MGYNLGTCTDETEAERDSRDYAMQAQIEGNVMLPTAAQRGEVRDLGAALQDGPKEKTTSGKKVPVVEIFGPTIEGEGHLIGTQTMFIRFGLCDYKCKMCDSMHAVDPALVRVLADWATQEEIYNTLMRFMQQKQCEHIQYVTFSGGNPAIHELGTLVALLQKSGKKVLVETQGTKDPDWLYNVDHIVVSPKSPGMGEKFDPAVFDNFMQKYLATGVPMSVKVVIFSAMDLEFAAAVASMCEVYEFGPKFRRANNFYLSLGNPLPPKFGILPRGMVEGPDVENIHTETVVESENIDKNALVVSLIKRYNLISEDLMKDHRLAFAKFLPQLHVLLYGNETGR